MKFGHIIKNIRKNNKITQEDLANDLYYSCQSISNWERNISNPPIDILLFLCNKFNYSLNYLFQDNIEDKKEHILNISMWIIKNDYDLNIKNIIKFSCVDEYDIKNILNNKNDKNNIIIFVINEYGKNIERDILKNIDNYDDKIDFITNNLIYILHSHKEILYYFFKSNDISETLSTYVKNKYFNIYIKQFDLENNIDNELFINFLIETLKIWILRFNTLDIKIVRKNLLKVMNSKIKYL